MHVQRVVELVDIGGEKGVKPAIGVHSVASAAGPRAAEVFADAVLSEFLLPELRTHKKVL